MDHLVEKTLGTPLAAHTARRVTDTVTDISRHWTSNVGAATKRVGDNVSGFSGPDSLDDDRRPPRAETILSENTKRTYTHNIYIYISPFLPWRAYLRDPPPARTGQSVTDPISTKRCYNERRRPARGGGGAAAWNDFWCVSHLRGHVKSAYTPHVSTVTQQPSVAGVFLMFFCILPSPTRRVRLLLRPHRVLRRVCSVRCTRFLHATFAVWWDRSYPDTLRTHHTTPG